MNTIHKLAVNAVIVSVLFDLGGCAGKKWPRKSEQADKWRICYL